MKGCKKFKIIKIEVFLLGRHLHSAEMFYTWQLRQPSQDANYDGPEKSDKFLYEIKIKSFDHVRFISLF